MKNPWMSMWLSAANKAANTGRGLWTAEAKKQQRAFLRGATKGAGPGTTGARGKTGTKRRAK